MKQTGVLDNACGIIACLHSVLNNLETVTVKPDTILNKYWNSAMNEDPAKRAALLEANEEFQKLHNSYAGEGQSVQAENQNQVQHHFIALVGNKDKQLVELDGTIKGPKIIAENCEDVLRGSIAEIKKRLENKEYSESLSMMTLCGK